MGKSEIKVVLRGADGGKAFVDSAPSPFNVVVEDTIVAVRGYYPKDARETMTMERFVQFVFGQSVRQLVTHPLYVHLFDKASFVTEAKQPEQDDRDRANSRPVALTRLNAMDMDERLDTKDRGEYGRIANSARDWMYAIKDRAMRQDIIVQLCRQACFMLPDMLRAAGVPPSHVMVLDYEEHGGKPIAIELTSQTSFEVGMWHTRKGRFVNQLGEYDVAALLYARHPGVREIVPTPNLLMRSIDSDMMPVFMLYCEDPVYPVHVEIKGTDKVPTSYFDPARAVSWIRDVKRECDDPVGDFIRAYVLSGTDFVMKGIPGVGNATFINKWVLDKRGDVDPAETLEDVLLATIDAAMNSKKINRVKIAALEDVQPVPMQLRSAWVLLYWRWSVVDPKRVPDPEGWGWSRHKGRLVTTESLTQGTAPPPPKRIKRIEDQEGTEDWL
jgi:hypothetical protein